MYFRSGSKSRQAWRSRSFPTLLLLGILFLGVASSLPAATASGPESGGSTAAGEAARVAGQIEVRPGSSDEAIDRRLTQILEATGWYSEIAVEVGEGVVFLDGRTASADDRAWAGELAGKTRDVVAVVNRIQVAEKSPWDLSPALGELQALWERTVQQLPRLGLGLITLLLVGAITLLTAMGLRRIFDYRLSPLLRDVAARVLSILVFLVGFYLVLQVAGLSRLAATVLGGTGLAGLVAGIAFRDILENYLASILISLRNPFRSGDLVEIAGHSGIVQRVTTRGTTLMNLDGNHVQIPNATVYKSIIRNYTANPNRREIFEVGIGFENEAAFAQEIALGILQEHPAVLKIPESLVLVDALGSATVNLKIYFWYDGSAYNGLKVRSSLIRLVKRAFEKERISMPDEAREILFPEGVPVRMLESVPPEGPQERPLEPSPPTPETVTTEAEGDLSSEDGQLREQARKGRSPDEGESLLEEDGGSR